MEAGLTAKMDSSADANNLHNVLPSILQQETRVAEPNVGVHAPHPLWNKGTTAIETDEHVALVHPSMT